MTNEEKELLNIISDSTELVGAYNIRRNGKSIERITTDEISITSKKDKEGIDVRVKKGSRNGLVHIPVIITEGGIKDKVYNDFYIEEDAHVVIIAGCGIHNDKHSDSEHEGIHRFFLEKGAMVKYIEKHYGEGKGDGKKILNPETEIYLKEDSSLEMETAQIKGVSSSIRNTYAELSENAKLVIVEKVMTHDEQFAKTNFNVKLNGKKSSVKVTSRTVAIDNSKQEFISNIEGNTECYAHVECDAIIKDNATSSSTPQISANHVDAELVHEAYIGKIAGEQLIKLMTLGLSKEEAEEIIINGFLK